MENIKKTPLFDVYEKYGGKVVDYSGWALPIQFEGIIPEHNAVRNNAGIFDVSHMGEVEIKGNEAFDYVQYLVTNDISVLDNNQIIYSFMCYPDGGIVDDLLVYKFSDTHFYLVINAGNVEKDYKWMLDNSKNFDVNLSNISNEVSEIALQGPKAQTILQNLTEMDLSKIKFFYCVRNVNISGVNCLVSRTGYTGEDGFEIYINPKDAKLIWNKIMEVGKEYDIKPAGLGSRDTLRFEATLPLYGNELSPEITPLEAGFGYFVKLDKDKFIGKDALVNQKKEGLKRKIVGFEMKEKGIPRHGYDISYNGKNIGFVTTGYFSPTLNKNIGLAMVDIEYSNIGNEIEILVRNKPKKALVISKRFYNKNYKK